MESAFNGDYVAQCGKRGHTSGRLPLPQLISCSHLWYKLIRKMSFIGPLKALQHAPCLIFIDDRDGKPGAFVGTVAGARFSKLEPVAL